MDEGRVEVCPAYMRIRARVFSRLSEGGRKWAGCGAGVEIEGKRERKRTVITSGQN